MLTQIFVVDLFAPAIPIDDLQWRADVQAPHRVVDRGGQRRQQDPEDGGEDQHPATGGRPADGAGHSAGGLA